MRILLVEDQQSLAHQVARRIQRAGFTVDHAASIRDALEALSDNSYAATVLDRRLPDGDGLSIISEIRRRQPASRVLILTALDAVDDRIAGLDSGADDYLVKPFDLEEMMARIRACLRRSSSTSAPPVIIGALKFDLSARTVTVAGRPALFHKRELALLEALVGRAGLIVRREALMGEIWSFDDDIQPHALTLLVSRLRIKLDQLEAGVDIHAARGIGYMIAERQA